MRRLAASLLAVALALLLCGVAVAAEPHFPALSGRVVDEAKLLSPATRQSLDDRLAQHEKATGQQVVVAVVASLQGVPIEDYGYQLGRAWGIGQKGKNDGAILLVAPNEHAVRIEVGYGLEGTLTDATSRSIIERDILPAFRKGDMERGVVDGTDAMLTVLGGGAAPAPAQRATASDADPGTVLLLVVPFFVILFIVFRFASRYGGGGVWLSGGSFGGSSRGGFSSGGFSGGGGSFGGGGASGQW
jgi:uncharacterized protein